jgi:methyl-accepting chemotaxis protein
MELDRYEEQEKNKSVLKLRITFFFVFFLVAVFAVFIITSVLQVSTVTRYICSQLALPTVQKALEIIDPDSFKKLAETLDGEDPYYEEARKALLELKEESNVLYLYTMAPEDENVYRYIIDGSGPPEDEDFSALGDLEDISEWDGAALATGRTKSTQMGTLDKSDLWDYTISAYEPILTKSGEFVGLIGCDIDASGIVSWIRTQVLWQLGIVVLLTAVGLVVYLTLIHRVNRSFD